MHFAAKELIPIMIAAVVWGRKWKGCKVTTLCDNSAVVAVLNSCYSQDKTLMQMLRCLFFIEAECQCTFMVKHISGQHNDLADDLS